MFGNRDESDGEGNANALLEQGCSFDGKLTFEGSVQINGHFTGEIFSEGTLLIGPAAIIEARVDVGNAVVYGKVQGELVAHDRIEMHRGAEVQGDITAKTLVIEEGVLFEGTCRMGVREGKAVRASVADEPASADFGVESFA